MYSCHDDNKIDFSLLSPADGSVTHHLGVGGSATITITGQLPNRTLSVVEETVEGAEPRGA